MNRNPDIYFFLLAVAIAPTAYAAEQQNMDENICNSTSNLRNFAPEAGRGTEIGFRVSY